MENPTEFDLNGAVQQWRHELDEAAELRPEDRAELETHLRDSISQLRSKGLTEAEAFLIARRRIGRAELMEQEFAKVHPRPLDKLVHGMVFGCFSLCCFFLWGMLMLPRMMQRVLDFHPVPGFAHRPFPAFTQLCLDFKWVFYVLPILAAVYLAVICFRRAPRHSWIGYFAATTSVVVVLALPVFCAILLPIIDFMNSAPK